MFRDLAKYLTILRHLYIRSVYSMMLVMVDFYNSISLTDIRYFSYPPELVSILSFFPLTSYTFRENGCTNYVDLILEL